MATQANRLTGDRQMPADPRIRTVHRSVKIVSAADAGLCWLLNLSDRRAVVETGLGVSIGEQVSLELADGITIDGSVGWRSGERTGIIFSTQIDSLMLIRQMLEERESGRLRPVRLAVSKLVEVASELGPSILRLQDISQRGLKLRHIGNLAAGMPITIHLSRELVVKGVVRWKRDSSAGVELNCMIPVCALMSRAAFEIA